MNNNLSRLSSLSLILLFLNGCSGGGLCPGNCGNMALDRDKLKLQHIAFLSSSRLSGNLGGLSGADALCDKLAKEGSVTMNYEGPWRAILSDATGSVRDRIRLSPEARIVNTNGQLIATKASTLWSGTLLAPISYDQNGKLITEKLEVWTGTLANGNKRDGVPLFTFCNNWTDNSTVSNAGTIGNAGATNQRWLESDEYLGCAKGEEKARLYCINFI